MCLGQRSVRCNEDPIPDDTWIISYYMYMWQSHVEIKYYSVMYFNRVTAFKVLYL